MRWPSQVEKKTRLSENYAQYTKVGIVPSTSIIVFVLKNLWCVLLVQYFWQFCLVHEDIFIHNIEIILFVIHDNYLCCQTFTKGLIWMWIASEVIVTCLALFSEYVKLIWRWTTPYMLGMKWLATLGSRWRLPTRRWHPLMGYLQYWWTT